MFTHKAAVSFISRTQKTAKTECGKIVKADLIAVNADCTCPGCIAAVDKLWVGNESMLALSKERGLDVTGLQASLTAARPLRYQTASFEQMVREALQTQGAPI